VPISKRRSRRLAGALALAVLALAVGAGAAGATPLSGPRGIVPARTLASRVFGVQPLRAGLRHRRGHRAARRVAPAVTAIAKLNYHGGPVMHTNKVYAIFWEPLSEEQSFSKGPPSYEEAVDNYFERVAADSGKSSNAYSVATQYYDLSGPGGAKADIAYSSSFGGSALYKHEFPTSEKCTDYEDEPHVGEFLVELKACLTEAQLKGAIEAVIAEKHWQAGLGSVFLIYTPKGVGSCANAGEDSSKPEAECTYTGEFGYCAYHDNFKVGSEEVVFANMPYEKTETCNDGAEPEHSDAGPAIDASSHEHNESITDPTGEAWWDGDEKEVEEVKEGKEPKNADYGEEVADLCVNAEYPFTYGPLLAGSTGYGTTTAFNQTIDGHPYLLQREWSEVAGIVSGACAQRLLPAAFTPPANPQATQPASFDGSASGTPEYPVVSWKWNFGDGSSLGEGATPQHTYAAPGEYAVTLTVSDAYEDSTTTSQRIVVAPAEVITTTPTSTSTSTTTAATSSTATTTATTVSITPPPAHLSSAELATMLDLPTSDASLSSTDAVTLGHASCPPACAVTASLYVTKHIVRHHHRSSTRVLVGVAHISIASGATAPIAVKLNAAGRALLRRSHRLVVQLVISASAQQGPAAQVTRTLTLSAPRGAPHRRR
jgi:PKD repeat protein